MNSRADRRTLVLMGAPVFLSGMMGSGKSTVGRALAAARGVAFVDLDRRIERMFGQTIAASFAVGESRFRALEGLALRSLLAEPGFAGRGSVVATGGGTVISAEHRAAMADVGVVVFLQVSIPQLVERLQGRDQRQARPLLCSPSEPGLQPRLESLARERDPAYRDRAIVVDGDGEPQVVMARVLAALDVGPQTGETAVSAR